LVPDGRGQLLALLDGMTGKPDVVAVINTSPDVVDMLRLTLEFAGIVVVTAMTWEIRDGEIDLERFITQHKPKVVLYDVAPPYENNWKLFEHISAMPVMAGVEFILTSTNSQQVQRLARGAARPVFEIVGKPFDLGEIVTAVREALKSRPTR
jgi:CheY-like chemotaxis protein